MKFLFFLLLAQFDYDAELPMNVASSEAEMIDGVTFREVSYESPRAGRVPAYLIAPEGEGPHAGIVFVHWGQGNRTEFVSEALVYAKAGAVSLLIDAPHMRPDFSRPRGFANPEGDLETFVQLVIDIRRAFDVLVARNDVDRERLGYVGHSLGATWGGALAGVDPRVRSFVLMGGLPTLAHPERNFSEPLWKRIERAFSEEQLREYRKVHSELSPEQFVGKAPPGSVFFQFARHDVFITEEAATTYERAATEPHVRWYQTSHEFNDIASLRDRAEWLEETLKLAPVLELLRSKLEP